MGDDFDDIKKIASLPTRKVPLCLAGEIVEQIEELERQLADAQPPTSLGDASPKRAIAERILALQDEMREKTRDFHLRAMSGRTWSKFWAGMPERAEGETAEAWDERSFPFYAELLSRSCTSPKMTPEQAAELADMVHGRSWNSLLGECMSLNMGTVEIPNSDAASELTQDSGQTSRRRSKPAPA